jgi:hypothetical protein
LPDPPDLVSQSSPISGVTGQALPVQMQPNTIVQTTGRGVLLAGLNSRRRSLFRLGLRHVGIEESTTVGSLVMDRTAALEQPVAVTVGLARWHQGRERLVDHGTEVLLGPEKNVLAWRTKSR